MTITRCNRARHSMEATYIVRYTLPNGARIVEYVCAPCLKEVKKAHRKATVTELRRSEQ